MQTITASERRAIEARFNEIDQVSRSAAIKSRPSWENSVPDVAFMEEAAFVVSWGRYSDKWDEIHKVGGAVFMTGLCVAILGGLLLFTALLWGLALAAAGSGLVWLAWKGATGNKEALQAEYRAELTQEARRWRAQATSVSDLRLVGQSSTGRVERYIEPVDHSDMFDVPQQS